MLGVGAACNPTLQGLRLEDKELLFYNTGCSLWFHAREALSSLATRTLAALIFDPRGWLQSRCPDDARGSRLRAVTRRSRSPPCGQHPTEAGPGRGQQPREPRARLLCQLFAARHGPGAAAGPGGSCLLHPGLWYRSGVRAFHFPAAAAWRDPGVWRSG